MMTSPIPAQAARGSLLPVSAVDSRAGSGTPAPRAETATTTVAAASTSTPQRQDPVATARPPIASGATVVPTLASALDSAKATVRCSPWWSASPAWTATRTSVPRPPASRQAPSVAQGARPAVSSAAPAAKPRSPVIRTGVRPTRRVNPAPTRPATTDPAAKTDRWALDRP